MLEGLQRCWLCRLDELLQKHSLQTSQLCFHLKKLLLRPKHFSFHELFYLCCSLKLLKKDPG